MTCAEQIWRMLVRPLEPGELVASLEDRYTRAAVYKALGRLKEQGAIQKRGRYYVRTGVYVPPLPGRPAAHAPQGFISVAALADRLCLTPGAVRERIHNGWAVSWVRIAGYFYVENRQSYPPMPGAPLQEALYDELTRPKAMKALAYGRSYDSVLCALRTLKARGLVEQVSYGVWSRV